MQPDSGVLFQWKSDQSVPERNDLHQKHVPTDPGFYRTSVFDRIKTDTRA